MKLCGGSCYRDKVFRVAGDSKAGHFAYIGDSGFSKVNLGAGTKLANLKSPVHHRHHGGGKTYHTGLKFGAILGDGEKAAQRHCSAPLWAKMCCLSERHGEAIILLKLSLNLRIQAKAMNLPAKLRRSASEDSDC